MAEGFQMQGMKLKGQAVKNLNLNIKAMGTDRRVFHHTGKLLWLEWEGQFGGVKIVVRDVHLGGCYDGASEG